MRLIDSIKYQWMYSFRQNSEREADDIPDLRERIGDILTAPTRWLVGTNLLVKGKPVFINTRILDSDIELNILFRTIKKVSRVVFLIAVFPLHLTGMIFYRLSSTRRPNTWYGNQINVTNIPFRTAFNGLTDNDIKELIQQLKLNPSVTLNASDTITLTNGAGDTDKSVQLNSSMRICGSGKVYFLKRRFIYLDHKLTCVIEPSVVTLPSHLKKKVHTFSQMTLPQVAVELLNSELVDNDFQEKFLVGPTNKSGMSDSWFRIGPNEGTVRQREADKSLWDLFSMRRMIDITLNKTATDFEYTIPQAALMDIDNGALNEILNNFAKELPKNPKDVKLLLKIPSNNAKPIEDWIVQVGDYRFEVPRNDLFNNIEKDYRAQIRHVLATASVYSEAATEFFKPTNPVKTS